MPRSQAPPPAPAATAAKTVLEVVPLIMRQIRCEMRAHGHGISVPQFRTLLFVDRNPGCSLAAAAEHLGITPATASATVDRLVRQGLMEREPARSERRRVQLNLTADGQELVHAARGSTQARLAERLSVLDGADLTRLETALALLRVALGEPCADHAVRLQSDDLAANDRPRSGNAK